MGQPVTVYYDPLNPAKNALTDFAALRNTAWGQTVILLFLVAAISGGVLILDIALTNRRIDDRAQQSR